MRHGNGGPEAWADRVFGYDAGEVCRAQAGGERHPGERFEFFVDEEGGEAAGSGLRIGKSRRQAFRIAGSVVGVRVIRAIEENAQMVIVVLVESKEANLEIVSDEVCAKAHLASGISRGWVIGGSGGVVVRRALIVGGVAMK